MLHTNIKTHSSITTIAGVASKRLAIFVHPLCTPSLRVFDEKGSPVCFNRKQLISLVHFSTSLVMPLDVFDTILLFW